MAKDIVLMINSEPVPCPSSMKYTLQTFDEGSGRSAGNGQMLRNVVCQKEALELSWNSANLTTQEISHLLKCVSPTFFEVTFFSPLEGRVVTKVMYVGDRNISFYSIINGKPVMDNISFSLIER